jgi:hypothetical protein
MWDPRIHPRRPGTEKAQDVTRTLTIVTASQQRPIWLAHLFMIPAIVLVGAFGAGALATLRTSGEWRQVTEPLPIVLLAAAVPSAVGLWRNWLTFDRDAGRLVHRWGYAFKLFGSREYDLGAFTHVDVAGVRPYMTTPNGRATPPLVDGVTNSGWKNFYDVTLVGDQQVLIQECHSYPGAVRVQRRLAEFLELPADPAPLPRTWLGANAHNALLVLSTPVLMIAGLGFWVVSLGALAGIGNFINAAIEFQSGPALMIVAGFVLLPVFTIALGTALVSRLPAACPRCGSKARVRWSSWWAPGLSFPHYGCSGCGATWTPSA